jgi:hypothetical protein
MASIARQEREKARQAQETAKNLRHRLKPVLDVLQPLNAEHRRMFVELVKTAGEKLLSNCFPTSDNRLTKRSKRGSRTGDIHAEIILPQR